ncbi:ABC transporter substrate-binding protein [Herbaspirillum seropedicae]|uniref:ABC-type nitrate/sulfonate/bicarbonate transport system, periplasmic component protein n=1 Tax=Herbaspirillum seropedicae (strain SmR1) TaxID=757424 RepID=D8ITU6_HERSS|nr:ABC transporter substrate-binding protein [Herbaspirillum seropedicae]ADJ61587.1 ABC-type nitrate/sulfonate/bicarbonate transport system, periplasmic component protein [Herbaspirillum seropedicae SmR1]AKN63807.1 nitrate ABC transporter substrate-binding protein [Herbaspirillum seropedicae]NQE30161.1 nitrate ABC transporter substrate-binding protein [Herbaspirillum seropedicae]UMU19715.1 ABC transporter substrate-binding protein [Herbaspirillum seropedicae]
MTLFPSFKERLRRLLTATLALSLLGAPLMARAEGQLRIAEQFGIVYLLLNVAQDQQLIEKHGKAAGVDIKVEWLKLSGGSAINDALLSGSVDIAGAGVGPLLTIWDRTYGRQNVRGAASLGNFPYYLVSNNPKVKTIADFSDKDRIALPAVGVSVQSRVLQLASAKLWGDAQYNRLDKISIAVPHPDATAAIISGGTEITGHFGNPPFQEQELAGNPNAHIVLKSYDVLGGPSSATVLYATEKFRKDNPKTYRAFLDALEETASFIRANPDKAADIYLKVNKGNTDRKLLLQIIKNPEVQFKIAPQNTYGLAEFMHRVGAIKNKPASVKDYFFDDPHVQGGS